MDIIENKRNNALATIAYMKRELAKLDKQSTQFSKKGIERWLGNRFESSSGLTPEFATFAREFRAALKKQCGTAFELVNFSRGHFYLSGFVKNKLTGKLVYFSTGDVRFLPDGWYNNILVRTAKHDKDYSGGPNNMSHWTNLYDKFIRLSN